MGKKPETDNSKKNPWTRQDEGDHYPSMREWWCVETLFKTIENNKKWSFKGSMAYEMENSYSFIIYNLFDVTSNKFVFGKEINDDINKLSHKKNKVDLKYKKSYISGKYPSYHIHFEDEKEEFEIDIDYKARILPHWSAQDSTNGYLPIGLSHYRYGWLINNDLKGHLKIHGKKYSIKGKGYLEHAWGDFLYSNPFKVLSDIKKTFSVYSKLGIWWAAHQTPRIPNKVSFTTENNPFGYDWFWGVFDNNWSIYYGNLLFWFSEGPGFGMLTICTDKGEYLEFGNIKFRYDKVKYIKKYDMYYPLDMTILASHNDEKLELRVWPVCDPHEFIEDFPKKGFYKAFIMPEMVGRMEGFYEKNGKRIKLTGDCKIERQRQPSVLGHNKITISFIKPPKGVGVEFDLDSHYLKKKLFTRIKLAPKPDLKFKISSRKNNIL